MHECLNSNDIPEFDEDCDFCMYRNAVGEVSE